MSVNKTGIRFGIAILLTVLVAALSVYLPSLRLTGEEDPVAASPTPEKERETAETVDPQRLTAWQRHQLIGRYPTDDAVKVERDENLSAGLIEQIMMLYDEGIEELTQLGVLPEELQVHLDESYFMISYSRLTYSDGEDSASVWAISAETEGLEHNVTATIDPDTGKLLSFHYGATVYEAEDFARQSYGYIGPFMSWCEEEFTHQSVYDAWGDYWDRDVTDQHAYHKPWLDYDGEENEAGEFDFVALVTYTDDEGDEWVFRHGWNLEDDVYIFYIRPYFTGS